MHVIDFRQTVMNQKLKKAVRQKQIISQQLSWLERCFWGGVVLKVLGSSPNLT